MANTNSFNAKQIVNAALGQLGGTYGTPMGMFGEYAQYSPKKYFAQEDYFNADDHFSAERMFDPNKVLKQAAGL